MCAGMAVISFSASGVLKSAVHISIRHTVVNAIGPSHTDQGEESTRILDFRAVIDLETILIRN